jgi:hypothetical protein
MVVTLIVPATVARADEARPLTKADGITTQSRFVGIDDQGAWTFKSPNAGEVTLPAAEVVQWGTPAEYTVGPILFLADGSVIAQLPSDPGQPAAAVKVEQDRLKIERSPFGPLSLPLECVRGVMFHAPPDAQLRDRLAQRLLDDRRDSDRVILDNGDEIEGTIESCDGKQLEVAGAVGKVQLEVTKVAAAAFNPKLVVRPADKGLHTLVGLANGTRVMARKLSVSGDKLTIDPAVGSELSWTMPLAEVVCLQPLGGKTVYLSDVPVEGYKHIPYLMLAWPYHTDRNVVGTQLRAGGRLYLKGIGMHSAARLTFKLDKPYRRFDAELAIDDETLGDGSVTFRVFVDSEQRFASEIVRGGMSPVPVQVDVAGGKTVSLVVDFAERADEQDHADWLNARLIE